MKGTTFHISSIKNMNILSDHSKTGISWGTSLTIARGFHIVAGVCQLTDSVDVADGGGGEVVVDDQVDAFEVNTSTHQLCTHQHPHLALHEAAYCVVTLKPAHISSSLTMPHPP